MLKPIDSKETMWIGLIQCVDSQHYIVTYASDINLVILHLDYHRYTELNRTLHSQGHWMQCQTILSASISFYGLPINIY
jgi:hypothetical protein